jgi:hypothetical protein
MTSPPKPNTALQVIWPCALMAQLWREGMMSDADRNVALLKDAYKKWGDSLGTSVDEWMKI